MTLVEEITHRVVNGPERFWRAADFKGSPSLVHAALARLVESGDLRRTRRDLFWRGTQTPLGMAPPSPQRLVTEIVGRAGVGHAGLSAAHALGLTTQVPRTIEFAIPCRVPTGISGIRLHSRAARWRRREADLAAAEVSLLEVLAEWDTVVELDHPAANRRLRGLVTDGVLRPDRLRRAASTEPRLVQHRLDDLLGIQ